VAFTNATYIDHPTGSVKILPTDRRSLKALLAINWRSWKASHGVVEDEQWNLSPLPSVPCKYRRILFTAIIWRSMGAWRNWHTLLTTNATSCHVNIKCYNLSMRLLHFVTSASDKGSPFWMDNFPEVTSYQRSLDRLALHHACSRYNFRGMLLLGEEQPIIHPLDLNS
jgi:hypothetical protein